MSDTIRWQKPPAHGANRNAAWAQTAAALAERPGEWALIAEGTVSHSTLVDRIKKGAGPWGVGSFEAVSRNSRAADDGRRCADVYARCVKAARR